MCKSCILPKYLCISLKNLKTFGEGLWIAG